MSFITFIQNGSNVISTGFNILSLPQNELSGYSLLDIFIALATFSITGLFIVRFINKRADTSPEVSSESDIIEPLLEGDYSVASTSKDISFDELNKRMPQDQTTFGSVTSPDWNKVPAGQYRTNDVSIEEYDRID